jgi:hypothetical protein
MLTFLIFVINLHCPKAYYRPDHSIRIVEYHRKKIFLNPTFSLEPKPRTVFEFVTFAPVISPRNNFVLGSVLLSCLVTELQKPPSLGLELRTLPEFWPFWNLFLVSRHELSKFDENWFIRSRVISEHTHTPPQCISMMAYPLYGILCRRYDRRHDAGRRVASVVLCGVSDWNLVVQSVDNHFTDWAIEYYIKCFCKLFCMILK